MTGVSGHWRLGHRPALDGLRGIAVLLVVVSHLSIGTGFVRSLGPIGVSVFFTLSGFLITSLLLDEREREGRVDLRSFYARRARRLMPAMVAVVVAVAAAGLVLGAGYVGWSLAAGALTYSSNWISMVGGGAGSALGHTWSLAIEEQFYVVWPLAFIALSRLGRRALVLGLGAAIATSLILCVALYPEGWQRVYYGSDTRAAGLLIGCLLAVLLREHRAPRGSAAAAAGAVVLIVAAAAGPLPFVFMMAPPAVALLTVVAIVASVGARRVRFLEWRPLRLVGQRAYGLYLWHYPVVIAASHLLEQPTMLEMAIAVLPASAALTVLSWRFVESPWLRHRQELAGPSAAAAAPLSAASASAST